MSHYNVVYEGTVVATTPMHAMVEFTDNKGEVKHKRVKISDYADGYNTMFVVKQFNNVKYRTTLGGTLTEQDALLTAVRALRPLNIASLLVKFKYAELIEKAQAVTEHIAFEERMKTLPAKKRHREVSYRGGEPINDDSEEFGNHYYDSFEINEWLHEVRADMNNQEICNEAQAQMITELQETLQIVKEIVGRPTLTFDWLKELQEALGDA